DQASLARLRARMEREQPFLDPELTIRGLAHQMGMGQRDLSRLINQQLGVHFFDFVNRYRVEHAAVLLCDPAHQDANILDIAYRSGFNTKSSFNAAFGKHLGTTPTALRRQAVIAPALA
ncbi:MAG: helix-turn-helix transcriptional regulator, partial [Dokdonella sp.]